MQNFGQIHGQARSGKNDIRLFLYGGTREFRKRCQRHHDIDADNSVGSRAGLAQLGGQGALVGLNGILRYIRFFHADHGTGNNADATFLCYGGGKTGKRNTYAHTALDDGHFGAEITDVQSGKRHIV